ncbi:hypothetical protein QQG55_44500 [Brugia pahangi]|uniref:Transposase n=1 Tax=Brugia pahangi TaxID=6280 RepID=A0A0N4SXZ4_BRUPA|nr:unnamed protein product [Brugia pahangi]
MTTPGLVQSQRQIVKKEFRELQGEQKAITSIMCLINSNVLLRRILNQFDDCNLKNPSIECDSGHLK